MVTLSDQNTVVLLHILRTTKNITVHVQKYGNNQAYFCRLHSYLFRNSGLFVNSIFLHMLPADCVSVSHNS